MRIQMAGRDIPVVMWTRDMQPISGGPENIIACDTETELIVNPVDFPDVVLGQFCNGEVVHLVHWQDMPVYLNQVYVCSPTAKWAFHNMPYDLGVMKHPDWLIEKIDKGDVIDTGIRWQLKDIATIGNMRSDEYPSLDQVTEDILGFHLNKDPEIRLGFRKDTEPSTDACKYAAEDALATWLCAYHMSPQGTEDIQVKCMIPLDTISRNGMLVDRDNFTALSKKLTDESQTLSTTLQDIWGLPIGKNKDLNGPQMLGVISELSGMNYDGEAKISISMVSALAFTAVRYIHNDTMHQQLVSIFDFNDNEDYEKSLKKARSGYDRYIADKLSLKDVPTNAKGDVTLTKKTLLNILYRIVRYLDEGQMPDEVIKHITEEYEECLGWSPKYSPEGIETIIQRNMEDIEKEMGVTFDRTKTGKIATNEEALGKYDVDHPFLNTYKRYKHLEKMISTYLNWDLIYEDGRVHPRFMYIKRTGRTSCRRPNLQNLPKEKGMREVYRAPEGYVLVSIDYNQLELCSLAQDCYFRFGKSRLGDMINKGIDVHAYLGGRLYGHIPEEVNINNDEEVAELITLIKKLKADPEFKQCRNMAKVANFGLPGGLSPKTFVLYAKGYDLVVTIKEATRIKEEWLRTFPEMELHLKAEPMYATIEESENSDSDFEKYTVTTYTGRKRNNTGWTAALNTKFQGTAADGIKVVMWELYKRGPLYKITDMIHDELIFELPYDEWLTPRIDHIMKIMEEKMHFIVPHVKIGTEAAVMFNWSKKAEEVRDKEGRYVPWELRDTVEAA